MLTSRHLLLLMVLPALAHGDPDDLQTGRYTVLAVVATTAQAAPCRP